jgi:pantothenate synthetase
MCAETVQAALHVQDTLAHFEEQCHQAVEHNQRVLDALQGLLNVQPVLDADFVLLSRAEQFHAAYRAMQQAVVMHLMRLSGPQCIHLHDEINLLTLRLQPAVKVLYPDLLLM